MSDTYSSFDGSSGGGASASEHLRATVLSFQRNLLLLKDSLCRGDLPSARQAFAALQTLGPTETKRVTMSAAVVSLGANAYVDLTRALEAGALNEARRAFIQLMSCLHAHPPTKRHYRPAPQVDTSGSHELQLVLAHGAHRIFS